MGIKNKSKNDKSFKLCKMISQTDVLDNLDKLLDSETHIAAQSQKD